MKRTLLVVACLLLAIAASARRDKANTDVLQPGKLTAAASTSSAQEESSSTASSCASKRESISPKALAVETVSELVIDNPFGDVHVRRVAGDQVTLTVQWTTPPDLDIISRTRFSHDLDSGVAKLSLVGPTVTLSDRPRRHRPGLEVSVLLHLSEVQQRAIEGPRVETFKAKLVAELAAALQVPGTRFEVTSVSVRGSGAVAVSFTINSPEGSEHDDDNVLETTTQPHLPMRTVYAEFRTQAFNPLSAVRRDGLYLPLIVAEEDQIESHSVEMSECDDGVYRSDCGLASAGARSFSASGALSTVAALAAGAVVALQLGLGRSGRSTWTAVHVVCVLVVVSTLATGALCPRATVHVDVGYAGCFVKTHPTDTRTILKFVACDHVSVVGGRCTVNGTTLPVCAPLRESIPISAMGVQMQYELETTSPGPMTKIEYQILSKECATTQDASSLPSKCAAERAAWKDGAGASLAEGRVQCGAECWDGSTLTQGEDYQFRMRLTDPAGETHELDCQHAKRNSPRLVAVHEALYRYEPGNNSPEELGESRNEAPVAGRIFNGHGRRPIDQNATSTTTNIRFRFEPFRDPQCYARLQHEVAVGRTECATDVVDWRAQDVAGARSVTSENVDRDLNLVDVTIGEIELTDGEYFVSVRAENRVSSKEKCHSGYVVDTAKPTFKASVTKFECDHSHPHNKMARATWEAQAASGISHVEFALADDAGTFLTEWSNKHPETGGRIPGSGSFDIAASSLNQYASHGDGRVYVSLRAASNAGVYSDVVTSATGVYMGNLAPGAGEVGYNARYITDGDIVSGAGALVRRAPLEIRWSGFTHAGYFLVGVGTVAPNGEDDDMIPFVRLDATKSRHVVTGLWQHGARYRATVVAGGDACRPAGGQQTVQQGEEVIVDFSPPELSSVKDGAQLGSDVDTVGQSSAVSVNWAVADTESGVDKVEVAVGTEADPEELKPFTLVDDWQSGVTTFAAPVNGMQKGVKYVATVRVTNKAGLVASDRSNGFSVE